MVGLSDIPCVGVVVNRISEATVEAGIRGLHYCLCSKNLVNNLYLEIGKVQILEVEVARKVSAARTDGKTIENHVWEWQTELENIKTLADELSGHGTSFTCFKVLHFPNPVSRFRLGREAAHQSKNVAELTVSGRELLSNEIAYLPAFENVPTSNNTYQSFVSRQEAYGKLWEALVNEDGYPVISIYGMPGVGKTRMMEEAWKNVMDKKIFDKVARVNVGGEKFDVVSLQDKLAVSLGCHLESKDENRRAFQLKNSLMNGGKTLVILDDVWDVIHLNSVGIPFGDGSSKGCKILLTSRKQNVCLGNNCKDPIELKTLTNTEAWGMFRNTVGISKIESLQDSSLPMKVCRECGALPLLIDAVGSVLKVLTENSWKDALYQLENCKFEEIDGIDPKVYTCLQFSFEKLAEGEKTCLLLCSFFPEDADISVKMLFDLATGSELLDSRRNIGGVIDILKSSSLLLQGKDVDTVKLHDVIRDLARSIAARDSDYAFLSIRCRSRLPDNAEYPSRRLLHLDLDGENVRFPDDLLCPKLHTLWMRFNNRSQQLSSGFFNAFMNLKVLLIKGKPYYEQQLYMSIHTLQKLRVLILDRCKINQTFLSSVSNNLETLCIWNCDLPRPLGLLELKNLRKLELLSQVEIEVVAKAISSLSSLEELSIPCGYSIRDAAATCISAELSTLICLRKLIINFRDSKSCLYNNTFDKLVEFGIHVGTCYFSAQPSLSKSSDIMFKKMSVDGGWMALVERAEEVNLEMVKDLTNGLSESNMRVGFSNLRELKIRICDDMEQVAKCLPLPSSFSKLTVLNIKRCRRMKYLFSSTVAKCLLQLQQLTVRYCNGIEEIIRVDDSTDHVAEIISFPNLKELHLEGLPRFTSFCNNKVAFTMLSQLKILKVKGCDKLEILIRVTMMHQFENLEQMYIGWCKSLKSVFQNSSPNNGHIVFPALTKLLLNFLPNLESFWSYDQEFAEVNPKVMFPNMVSFQIMYLNASLREEIELGRDDDSPSTLTTLRVSYSNSQVLPSQWKHQLQNLETLKLSNCWWPGHSLFNCALTFKRLRVLEVDSCECSTLFTSPVFRSLQQLEKVRVSDCSLLKEIVEEEDVRGDGINEKTRISLLQLKTTVLLDLPNLQNSGISACYMPALETVVVENCRVLSSLFKCSAYKNLQQLQMLKVSYCPLLEEIVEEEMDIETPGTSETMISLLVLKKIKLVHLPRLKSSIRSSIFSFNMPALVDVEVDNCGLSSLFTCSVFRNLQRLKSLRVSDCSLLEKIVEDKMDNETHGINLKTHISLLELESVILEHLPNLQNSGLCATHMPSLKVVEVRNCGLSSLFSCSAFKNHQLVETLKVIDCPLLEEIVKYEMDDGSQGTNEKIISLEEIELKCLPRLKCLSSSSTFTFKLTALCDVTLSDFPCMDKFSLEINQEDVDESDEDGDTGVSNSTADLTVDGDEAGDRNQEMANILLSLDST